MSGRSLDLPRPLPDPLELGRDFAIHVVPSPDGDRVVKVVVADPSPAVVSRRERLLEQEDEALRRLAKTPAARHIPRPLGLTRLPDGRLALVRSYVPGVSLADLVERALLRRRFQGARRWNAPTRLLAAELLGAVQALHRAGFAHNDLKPEDVLVALEPDGGMRVTLIDLGLARRAGHPVSGGTVTWAAPERLAGAPGTPRSDVWSLGALLYLTLTGKPPYPEGEDGLTNAIDARLARATPVSKPRDQAAIHAWRDLERHGQEVGVDLCTVLDRALSADPRRRHRDAGALARALGLAAGQGSTRDVNPRHETTRAALSKRLVALPALLAATALGLALAWGPVSAALGLSPPASARDPIACGVLRERAERLCATASAPGECVRTLIAAPDCRERAALLGACGGG